jgi:hypothetical protein
VLATEITGKVTAVSGDTVTIAADAANAQPLAGDSVAVYFQIPGVDKPARVGSGQVVSVEAGRIVARIDRRTGTLAVGQIAKIQASGKPVSSGRVAPAGKTGDQLLSVEEQTPGWLATDAFRSAGVSWAKGEGDPRVLEPEPNMVLPSGRKRLLLLDGGPVTSLTIKFRPSVKRFSLTRIGTAGGASVPTWSLEAFDARGNKLDSTGEEHGLPPQPQQFSLKGDGIVRVVLRSDNRYGNGTWATWNSLPVVEFELER